MNLLDLNISMCDIQNINSKYVSFKITNKDTKKSMRLSRREYWLFYRLRITDSQVSYEDLSDFMSKILLQDISFKSCIYTISSLREKLNKLFNREKFCISIIKSQHFYMHRNPMFNN